MRTVDARLKFNAGILQIDRLSIGDLAGAALDISGRIDELSSRPRGRLTLAIDARSLAGLPKLRRQVRAAGGSAVRPFVDRLAPAKLHGALTVDGAATAGTAAKLTLDGELGALRLTLNGGATGEPAHPAAAVVRIDSRFDADDGGALVRLLDLDRVVAVDQLPGQMTISANGPLNGEFKSTAGACRRFFRAADGTLHLSGEEAPTGSLQVKASAADLRPLHRALTGQAGSALCQFRRARLSVSPGRDLSVTDLVAGIGKIFGPRASSISSFESNCDRWRRSPPTTSTLRPRWPCCSGCRARPPSGGKLWSAAPFGPGMLSAMRRDITFKVDRVALTAALAVHGLKGMLRFQPPQIELRELDGGLAGGRLTGAQLSARGARSLRRKDSIELADAHAATLVTGAERDRRRRDGETARRSARI